mmetsp:Transcript_7865/g.14470  ORF Transcript_7865/g.14470 Transcript_7865/m.14470 type:complete len:322 (+) Transcript_7865:95-1060(+)
MVVEDKSAGSTRKWKADVAKDLLDMRGELDKLHVPQADLSASTKKKKKKESKQPPPSSTGSYDLFQEVAPGTFVGASGHGESWRPPVALIHGEEGETDASFGESWMGVLDRTEIVKSLKRVTNHNDKPLVGIEYTYATRMIETIEHNMTQENWESAYRCAVDLIRRFPNFSLAYWKAGLCLILLRGMPKPVSSQSQRKLHGSPESSKKKGFETAYIDASTHSSFGVSSAETVDDQSEFTNIGTPDKGFKDGVLKEAALFFRCALHCEPTNVHLGGLVDLAIRQAVGIHVARASALRDPALYPRSLGDAVALAIIDRPELKR